MKIEQEIFKDISGFENLYTISNKGKVWSKISKSLRKTHIDKYGYENITLCKNGKLYNFKVHRLVAAAFIPNPENKPCINHKDENKLNNSVENLEWVTVKENNNYGSRLSKLEKPVICKTTGQKYKSAREAARKTGVSSANIVRCCNGKRKTAGKNCWQYVKEGAS